MMMKAPPTSLSHRRGAAPKAKSPEQAFSPMNEAEEAFAGVAGVEVGVIGIVC